MMRSTSSYVVVILASLVRLALVLCIDFSTAFVVGALLAAPFVWLWGSTDVRGVATLVGFVVAGVGTVVSLVYRVSRVSDAYQRRSRP